MNNQKYKRIFISTAGTIAVWEIISRFGIVDDFFISSPGKVWSEGMGLVSSGVLWPHLLISLETLFAGIFLAILVGVSLGILIGSSETVRDYLHPHVSILNSLPKVAVIPLIIIWFGVGLPSKISIVFLMALVPILMNTIDGAKNTDKNLLKMARSFDAGRIFTVWSVTFFSSLPFVFSGLRIASGRAVVGLIIAEIFGYGKGLGYLVSFYGINFQTAKLLFIVIILIFINVFLLKIVKISEKNLITWR
ncbi:MAG TPA: hypothetical protein DIT25_02750 [Candidatus Moranbacteria bacterium]|nr:hypothetical protein [Candidatus Moranbacteria bacterium]